MRKKLSLISIVICIITMLYTSILSSYATTYYVIDNLKLTDIDNSRAIFCGYLSDSETLSIPDAIGGKSIVAIDERALLGNTTLKSIDLSNAVNVKTVGESAFHNCSALESVVIPSWMKYLSGYLFTNCISLESVEILSNISKISDYMFSGCSSLREFDIPESVTKIEKFAFANCASLEIVTVPANVTSIAISAFDNSPNLTLGVYDDSYALQYAKEHNIPYVLLDEYKLGDVDGNGNVDIRDVTEIQKHLAELGEPLGELNLYAADVNGDGDVDISDATAIQMFLAELDFSYPIGEITSKSN